MIEYVIKTGMVVLATFFILHLFGVLDNVIAPVLGSMISMMISYYFDEILAAFTKFIKHIL